MQLTSTSIVIPTYNEAKNLPILLEKISDISAHFQSLEVIIIDDQSKDETSLVLNEFARKFPWLRYEIRTQLPCDLSQSVLLGFKMAQKENIVVMDADLSHPPLDVIRLIQALETNPAANLVLGSRFTAGGSTDASWPWLRKWNAYIAKFIVKELTSVKDPLSGFFAFRRSLLSQSKNLNPIGYKIGLELIVKTSAKHIIEMPIYFAERSKGNSKLNFKQRWNFLKHLYRLYRYKMSKP